MKAEWFYLMLYLIALRTVLLSPVDIYRAAEVRRFENDYLNNRILYCM